MWNALGIPATSPFVELLTSVSLGVNTLNPLEGAGIFALLTLIVILLLLLRRGPILDGTVLIRSGPVEISEFVLVGRRMDVPPNSFGVVGLVKGVRRRKGSPAAIRVRLRYAKQRGSCVVLDGHTEQVSATERYSYPLTVSFTSRRSRILSQITDRRTP